PSPNEPNEHSERKPTQPTAQAECLRDGALEIALQFGLARHPDLRQRLGVDERDLTDHLARSLRRAIASLAEDGLPMTFANLAAGPHTPAEGFRFLNERHWTAELERSHAWLIELARRRRLAFVSEVAAFSATDFDRDVRECVARVQQALDAVLE